MMRADEEVLDKQEFETDIFWLDEFEGEAKGGLWFRAFDLNKFIQKANENHFGFGDIQITENAQFTEYPVGGFYDWHMDCDVHMAHEPPVRKISMTLLLNDPSEFKGGDLELTAPGKFAELKQGHAIVFASFLNHRVAPVTEGVRQSLVVWFGGKPFR